MVVYCSVCMNNNRKNKLISYFNYPKDSERRYQWLKAVRREDLLTKLDDEKTRQQYRICEDHFERTCIKYSKKRTIKYLYDFAFPTLRLPSNDGVCSSQQENVTEKENQPIVIMPDVKEIVLNLTEEIPKEEEIAQERQERTKNKEYDLDSVTTEDFLTLCDKFLTKGMSQVIKWQINMKAGHKEYRQSQDFQFFALSLYHCSVRTYRFLSNILSLPTLITLKKLVKPIGTKVDDRLLYALKTKVDKMGWQEKVCSVSVNYISVKSNLFYDISNDRIVGFHEINGIQIKAPAKYAIVIIVRGIVYDWKQPVAHAFLSQCISYPEINDWIDEIITSLLNIGLDIRVFVSELRADFVKGSRSRFVSKDKTYFEVKGRKIYYMFDVPHLLKCARNSLKKCDFSFDGKLAKWSHIVEMYNIDKRRNNRLAPKLTHSHMYPNNFRKTRVKLATQVFSRTVASAIELV